MRAEAQAFEANTVLASEFNRMKASLGVKDGEGISFTVQFDEATSVWRMSAQWQECNS